MLSSHSAGRGILIIGIWLWSSWDPPRATAFINSRISLKTLFPGLLVERSTRLTYNPRRINAQVRSRHLSLAEFLSKHFFSWPACWVDKQIGYAKKITWINPRLPTFHHGPQAMAIIVVPYSKAPISTSCDQPPPCVVKCHACDGSITVGFSIFKYRITRFKVPNFDRLKENNKVEAFLVKHK
jgi:hypothetical protein